MKIKAFYTAAALIFLLMLCGCEVRESTAETDVYSKALSSDASDESQTSRKEVDVSHKAEVSSSGSDSDTDTDTGSTRTVSSEGSSSRNVSTVTSVTREVTTYYYYYETEETDEQSESESSDTESESTDSDTDTQSSSSAVSESDSDAGDSDTEDTQTDSENTDTQTDAFSESDLDFVVGETRIKLGDVISDYSQALGEPIHVTEITNADSVITGKTYDYESFSINTVPDENGENDIVSSIEIFSDSISTEKGIKTGDAIEKVVSAYGSHWIRCEDEYRYYSGNSYVYFYVQNDIVANIGYRTDKDMEN